MNIIFIDSGTTNSRIRLGKLEEQVILDSIKVNIGVRNTAIDGNNYKLITALREAILKIIAKNNLSSSEIDYLIASGMITSNLGIYEVPHISSPASVEDFSQAAVMKKISDFFDIKCILIPGMKNSVKANNDIVSQINNYDIMRGEEVEAIGLLDQLPRNGKGILILPGSHTKYILVDEQKRLTKCFSTLGGEALLAIQKESILSNSLSQELITSLDLENLIKGYQAAEKYGVTRGLYQVRLLEIFSDLNKNKLANYYTGVIMHEDIKFLVENILKENVLEWIMIGGANPLKKVFFCLLKYLKIDLSLIEASDRQGEYSTVIGSRIIAANLIK